MLEKSTATSRKQLCSVRIVETDASGVVGISTHDCVPVARMMLPIQRTTCILDRNPLPCRKPFAVAICGHAGIRAMKLLLAVEAKKRDLIICPGVSVIRPEHTQACRIVSQVSSVLALF